MYSAREAERGYVYRLADRLHVETRRSVIEQFLLFHQGDIYEPSRLQETERNLRALSFLKSASVTASEPHDGVVDVQVITQDAWSIAPETQAGMRGGAKTYGTTISEANLLGYGKDLAIGWHKTVDRRSLFLNYNDPAFFAPYMRAHFGYAHNSDGFARSVSLQRPFFSFSTPWSSLGALDTFRQNDRLYANGIEVSRFNQTHREIAAAFGVARDPNDERANRVVSGVRFIDDDFAPIAGYSGISATRDFRYVFVRFDHAENDYVKLNFVNKDIRYEDFNLGRRYSAEAALSPTAFGVSHNTEFVRFTASDGAHVGDNGFLMPSAGISTRYGSGFQNALATANVLYVLRSGSERPQTLVGRMTFNSGWRMDPELQFFADGLTGLRGYRVHTFAGSRSFMLNVEERFYLGREILQLASPGLVAFIDTGNATDGGLSSLMALKTDVGIGIRVGLPRTPKNLLRIDLGYAVNRDPLGRRGWLVSFSSGQAF